MNALTKLFVSLLIVCSLLLTGGVVVFVNKTDKFDDKLKAAEADRDLAKREANSANAAASTAQAQNTVALAQLNETLQKSKEQAQAAENEKSKLQADLNKANTGLAVAMGQNTSSLAAVTELTKNISDLQKRLDSTVKENDVLIARNTEVVGANTDLTKRLDALERERRNLTEQLVQAKADLDRAQKLVQTAGLNPASTLVRPAEDVRGVIRKVQTQEGVVYATISLGAKDRIEKGMRFAIYNESTQKYLATLTVSAVEAGEAFGRVEGPAIASVVVGNSVIPDPSPIASQR